jgi:hypothetical protein
MDKEPRYLYLTARQSCNIHGWLNPKRTLHWDDVREKKALTIKALLGHGLTSIDLKSLQPDVEQWIQSGKASLSDVPSMLAWPLHPVKHLRANISDLSTMHYYPSVLGRLGITYSLMRDEMGMSDDWMKIMRYTPLEWASIGFDRTHATAMGENRVRSVFGMDPDALVLLVASYVKFPEC